MNATAWALVVQAAKGMVFYFVLVLMMRLAGKRLAGQTTTFDLLVLVSLSVSVQGALLGPGPFDTVVFVVVVFAVHRGLSAACRASPAIRHLVRGKPRALVRDGVVIDAALEAEHVSPDELLAGLRRLGFEHPRDVHLAVLEETGHISAVGIEHPAPSGRQGDIEG